MLLLPEIIHRGATDQLDKDMGRLVVLIAVAACQVLLEVWLIVFAVVPAVRQANWADYTTTVCGMLRLYVFQQLHLLESLGRAGGERTSKSESGFGLETQRFLVVRPLTNGTEVIITTICTLVAHTDKVLAAALVTHNALVVRR